MQAEGLNGKQLAERLNVSPSTISRTVGLLSLSEAVQAQVDASDLAITRALKTTGQDEPVSKAKRAAKQRPNKEAKHKTSLGITVSFRAHKLLKPEGVTAAVQEVLQQLTELKEAA